MSAAPTNSDEAFPAKWYRKRADGRLLCELCPRACVLSEGQRGLCFVRACQNHRMVLTTYGRSTGFQIDPIEKKPLNHFYPGSTCLSFGTAGCNLTCTFCQNHTISKSREMDILSKTATPVQIADAARRRQCPSVAYTYNDPVIFAEYAIDTAAACKAIGIASVAVTAGYICPEPRRDFFAAMDATNIDLKSFSEDFYKRNCTAKLGAVLDTLRYVAHETSCWLEVTTLLIPGLNDSSQEIDQLSRWMMDNLGPDVPLHFTAFRPEYRLLSRERTPLATLQQARRIAKSNGLNYVYVGNISDVEGASTTCPACHKPVIERDRYRILSYALTTDGACQACGTRVPGRFGESPQIATPRPH